MEKFAENLDGLITHLEDSLNKNTVGMNIELILAVMNTTELIVEIRPEKSSGPTGCEPMTSVILVQCSTN